MNYELHYYRLILKRKFSPLYKTDNVYTENHHIRPLCFGGSNDESNLVRLTAREHFIAHRLLFHIYDSAGQKTSAAKMALALVFFSGQSIDRKQRLVDIRSWISSRTFQKFKEIAHKARIIPCSRSALGKQWVTNDIEQRLIKKEDVDSFLASNAGWRRGQKFVHRTSWKNSANYQQRCKKITAAIKRRAQSGSFQKQCRITETERKRRQKHCAAIGKTLKDTIWIHRPGIGKPKHWNKTVPIPAGWILGKGKQKKRI